jgi:transcriptional regulator with XRE-family HTH domain
MSIKPNVIVGDRKRVWSAMRKQGITITGVSERVGMSRAQVSRWLNGHSDIRLENYRRICAALNMKGDS